MIFKHKKGVAHSRGFTLLEMVVTIGIFVVITAVVLANFPQFGSRLALGRIAREMALTIRQAQVFGIAVSEIPVGQTRTSPPFGVYFSTSRPKEFVFFSDTGVTTGTGPDGQYEEGSGCRTAETECYEQYKFQGSEYIKEICFGEQCFRTSQEDPNFQQKDMAVTFVRPDPEAIIYDGALRSPESSVTITLTSSRFPDKVKKIRITVTGQIAVIE